MALEYKSWDTMRIKLFHDWNGNGNYKLSNQVRVAKETDARHGYGEGSVVPRKYRAWYDRLASPSQSVLIRRIGKSNIAKLEQLMDAPSRVYIPDVGFHTPYRFADDIVYCIDAGEPQRIHKDLERPIMVIKEIEAEEEQAYYHHPSWTRVRERYVDTLTKGSQAKLAMLQVMCNGEVNKTHWLEGIGGVRTMNTYAGRALGYNVHNIFIIVKDKKAAKL